VATSVELAGADVDALDVGGLVVLVVCGTAAAGLVVPPECWVAVRRAE
jgi:hypothetical protein